MSYYMYKKIQNFVNCLQFSEIAVVDCLYYYFSFIQYLKGNLALTEDQICLNLIAYVTIDEQLALC